jgi:hypothetical protein
VWKAFYENSCDTDKNVLRNSSSELLFPLPVAMTRTLTQRVKWTWYQSTVRDCKALWEMTSVLWRKARWLGSCRELCMSQCALFNLLFFFFFEYPPHRSNFSSTKQTTKESKFCGLSSRTNYTDQEAAACRRSQCQLSPIEGVAWPAQHVSAWARGSELVPGSRGSCVSCSLLSLTD